MALGWLSERFEPPGPPGDDPALLTPFWAGAAEADAAAIWERVAAGLGPQAAPPLWWRLSGPLSALPEAQRRAALASAGVAAASVLGAVVLLDGSTAPASGGSLMTDVSQLAVATDLALRDGVLDGTELDNLNAISDAVAARLLDAGGAAALTGPELDRTIGALAAARAALIEQLTLSPGSGQPTLDRLATLSALAVQLRIARGDMGTLVVARPVDPRAAAVEEVVRVADLPLTVTAGGLGSVQVLGSTAALQVGEVAAAPGWVGRVVAGEGSALTITFERGRESVRVVARLAGSDIVVAVTDASVIDASLTDVPVTEASVTSDSSPATTLPEFDVHAFAVRLAGFVVLERHDDELLVRRVEPEWGWQAGEVEAHDARVTVDFSGPVSSVRFRAVLRNGVIHTEVRELPLPRVGPAPDTLADLLAGELVDPTSAPADDPPAPAGVAVNAPPPAADTDPPTDGGQTDDTVGLVPEPDDSATGTEGTDSPSAGEPLPADPADEPAGTVDDPPPAPASSPPPSEPAPPPADTLAPAPAPDPNDAGPDGEATGDPPSDAAGEAPADQSDSPLNETIATAGGDVTVEVNGRAIAGLAAAAADGWTVERQSFQGASARVDFAMGASHLQVEIQYANGSLSWSVQELPAPELRPQPAGPAPAAAPLPAKPEAGHGPAAGNPGRERGRGGGH